MVSPDQPQGPRGQLQGLRFLLPLEPHVLLLVGSVGDDRGLRAIEPRNALSMIGANGGHGPVAGAGSISFGGRIILPSIR